MAMFQPSRKKRKLSSDTNTNTNNNKNSNSKVVKSDNEDSAKYNIMDLIQLIENEPDENVEINILYEMIKILKFEINKNKIDGDNDYDLYLKLSWSYLRSGQYDEGIAFFAKILPYRDHDKFYIVNNNDNHHKKKNDDIKNGEEYDDDSDLESYLKKKKKKFKKKKKKKQKKQRLKKLEKLEINRVRLNGLKLNKNKDKNKEDESESDDECKELTDIPLKYEISIRTNIGLMLCRICDFEEALRMTYIMRDLYLTEYKNKRYDDVNNEYMRYDPYIDYIEMLIVYQQKCWYQCIEKANIILKHSEIKKSLKNKHCSLICILDNHSLFELYCILADCYSKIGQLSDADQIFEDIILQHIICKNGGNNKLDLNIKYQWIYQIYLRHLSFKKEWKKGYNLCCKLFAANISYRYNEIIMKLAECFNLHYHLNEDDDDKDDDIYHFIVDAEYFGNQTRFVNHSNDIKLINCIFTVRYRFGNTSYPSSMEVWLKSIKKIDKNTELLVNYGDKYWENINYSPKLRKRQRWDQDFIFTHLTLDEMGSHFEIKQLINKHHLENPLLANKNYPNSIKIIKDKYGGFGAFSTKTIKKDAFILGYAGIRKMSTTHDQSKSRYAIEIKNYK